MTVHVFAGPSLQVPVPDGVVLHPPVEHGSAYRIGVTATDAVLVIDGVYQHSAPVRHKELLALIERGVAVYGAGSIGALRACELAGHGMTGLGTVFGWYRDGRLDSDADVALLHGDGDAAFRPFTHAVVTLLGAVDALLDSRRLSTTDADVLLALVRGVHFTERSTGALLAAARTAGFAEQMRVLLDAVAAPGGDVKQTDARQAVAAVIARHAGAATAPRTGRRAEPVPDTSYRREWELEHVPVEPGGPTRRRVLAFAQLFLADYPQIHTRYVLGALEPEHPRVGATRAEWVDTLGAADLVARGLLTAAEATAAPQEHAQRVVVRSFRLRSGRLVYERFPAELLPRLGELTGQCARMLQLSERAIAANPRFHPADVAAGLVTDVFRVLWRTDDLPTHLLDRGFRDVDDFVAQARPFFVAAKASVAMTATRSSG